MTRLAAEGLTRALPMDPTSSCLLRTAAVTALPAPPLPLLPRLLPPDRHLLLPTTPTRAACTMDTVLSPALQLPLPSRTLRRCRAHHPCSIPFHPPSSSARLRLLRASVRVRLRSWRSRTVHGHHRPSARGVPCSHHHSCRARRHCLHRHTLPLLWRPDAPVQPTGPLMPLQMRSAA
jgi:hypothetical protein